MMDEAYKMLGRLIAVLHKHDVDGFLAQYHLQIAIGSEKVTRSKLDAVATVVTRVGSASKALRVEDQPALEEGYEVLGRLLIPSFNYGNIEHLLMNLYTAIRLYLDPIRKEDEIDVVIKATIAAKAGLQVLDEG